MNWLKSHSRWSALNLSAGCVLVYVLSQGSTGWASLDTFDTGLESGKWAIRFLLISLSMSPLNTYFGWTGAIKLRKSAGLWSFGFACIHVLLYLRESVLGWLTWPLPDFLVLGFVGMTILIALAVTSNTWSMKRLGKTWKRLHRRIYLAGVAVTTHSMLATTMSKRLIVRDPEAPYELKIYAAVLCALLVVRLPVVRELLLQIPILLKHTVKKLSCPVAIPDTGIETLPKIQDRESSISVEPTFIIPNTISNHSLWHDIHGLAENKVHDLSTEFPLEEKAEIQ